MAVASVPDDPSTARALSGAIAGDREAISEIWREWNPRLLRFFRARRANEPDDLAQLVWLEVAPKLPAFEGDAAAFRRWLFTLAHRRLIDAGRAAQRRPTPGPIDDTFEHPARRFDDEVDGLDWALSLLAELPDKQATAVSLRILGGLPAADVAVVMGETDANVRVLTHRGLRRLERMLEPLERNSSDHVTPDSIPTLTPIT